MKQTIDMIIKSTVLESKLYKADNETEYTEYVIWKLVGYEHPDHPGKIFGTAIVNDMNMCSGATLGIYTALRFADVVTSNRIKFNVFGNHVPTWDQCIEFWNEFVDGLWYES